LEACVIVLNGLWQSLSPPGVVASIVGRLCDAICGSGSGVSRASLRLKLCVPRAHNALLSRLCGVLVCGVSLHCPSPTRVLSFPPVALQSR
jgi:hypothetical protein